MSSDEASINSDKEILGNEDEVVGIADDGENGDENTEEVQRDGENEDGVERQTVKPKRVVRNPQPKLNEETLKGPRGIAALGSYFDRVKFKGKGCETHDLNAIMKTYEYWSHRLFPKFPFDHCIERLEKLGTKKAVQTHIRRIRFDLLVEDKPIIDSSDEENNVEGFVNIQNDQVNQQNQQFDQLLVNPVQTNNKIMELSEEQLERMRINKERAEKIRQERLRKIRDKAEVNLEPSSQLPGASGLDMEVTEQEFDTQSDVFSQDVQKTTVHYAEFDLESNVKGKSTIGGSTVKKKSRIINRIEQSTLSDGSDIEEEPKKKSPKKINNLRLNESDQENSDNDSISKIKSKIKHKNVIDSDESDQNMEDLTGKSGVEVENDTNIPKKTNSSRIIDSDSSDEELDKNTDSESLEKPKVLLKESVNGAEEIKNEGKQVEMTDVSKMSKSSEDVENKENSGLDNVS